MTASFRGVCLIISLLATFANPLQAKSLFWKSLDVRARIDRDGDLHVVETHAMVFDGDWNGGERRFDIRLGQDLHLETIERIDDSGNHIALRPGNLSGVDQYAWMKGHTLRWRSRNTFDAPFANKTLVYAITYTITNVVLDDGDHYRLDHAFAFADRPGPIERFTLQLGLDPAFRPLIASPLHWEVANIPPGETFGARLPLQFTGAGSPKPLHRGASAPIRFALVSILLLASAALVIMFYRREVAWGSFEPRANVMVDDAWLRANLFPMAPEVAGATWDDSTGSAEVAALIARLVQETKLSSNVDKDGGDDVLRLKLLVDRSQFRDYEQKLITALFFDGRTEVTTKDVKEHYKKSGFKPASKIRGGLEKAANRVIGGHKARGIRRPVLPIAILFAVAISLVTAACVVEPINVIGVLLFLFPSVFCLVGSTFLASKFSSRAEKRPISIAVMLGPTIALGVLFSAAILGVFETGFYHPSALLLLGLVIAFVAFLSVVLAAGMTADSRERLGVRRRLIAARDFFREQLRKREPLLHDDWYPYMIAFGLGPNVNKWFRAYGSSRIGGMTSASHGGSSATTSSSSSGSTWTGGGGAFGGAGASGVWAAAAGSLAAGVSSAARGGGGGGGGGFSSGGGGGGGW